MHWSGCPAACGNHQAADVGFLGGKALVDGAVVETFDVFVEGRTGLNPQPGQRVLEKVPATEIHLVAERLVQAHAHGESLQQVAEEIAAERAARAERGAQEDAAVADGG